MTTSYKTPSTGLISVFKTPEGEALYQQAYAASMTHWSAAYETLELNTRFARTHVIVSGPKEAPPLVLIHGYGFTSAEWCQTIGDFSQNYRTYAVDVPGQVGKSVMLQPIKSRTDYMAWLKEVFDLLHLEQACLLGHSYGGWLALAFALASPERVSKLVLLAPGGCFKPMKVGFYIRGMICNILPYQFLINRLLEWMSARESKGKLQDIAYLTEQFFVSFKYFKPVVSVLPDVFSDDELKQLKIPSLLMFGEQEVICDLPGMLCRAGRLIPQLKITLVPAAGHGLILEHPALVTATVLNFLNGGTLAEPGVVPLEVALAR